MKRFVIKNDDGTIGMTATSGFMPPNYLCEAHDDWIIDEITYSDGIVYVDPDKVRKKRLAQEQEAKIKAYEDFQIKVTRVKEKFRRKFWALVLLVAIGIAAYMLR